MSGKPFSVTITGKPSAYYYLWVKSTSGNDYAVDSMAPLIGPNQLGVNVSDLLAANYTYLNSHSLSQEIQRITMEMGSAKMAT